MEEPHPGDIVGISEHARCLRDFVKEAAKSSDPVTLVGEPGTGKQLAARNIHAESPRRKGPFLMIDCSLYYERELQRELFGFRTDGEGGRKGLFEFAAKGTCYLSRIEELSPGLQAGLGSFLDSRRCRPVGGGKEVPSGVRLIASSDKNLPGLVEAGLFDKKLYERLARKTRILSPLRERKEDIPALVDHMVNQFSAEMNRTERVAFVPTAVRALEAYPWPDNLDGLAREINRLVESGVRYIRSENLSAEISSYWLGQHCDPQVRKVLEELDGCIREFKILSRLETELGEVAPSLDGWLSEDPYSTQNLLEEY